MKTKGKGKSKKTTVQQDVVTDRQLAFWLLNNSIRGNCWIFYHYCDKILGHDDVIFYDKDGVVLFDEMKDTVRKDLQPSNLEYVYSAYLSDEKLIAIISTKSKHYYVIKNVNHDFIREREERLEKLKRAQNENSKDTVEKTDDELLMEMDEKEQKAEQKEQDEHEHGPFYNRFKEHTSSIWVSKSLKDTIKLLSSQERKLLMVKKLNQMTLTKIEKDALIDKDAILPMDFLYKSNDELVELWKKYVNTRNYEINLSDIFIIDSNFIDVHSEGLKNNSNIKRIFMHQNENIKTFEWLRHFPNIEEFIITYSYQLQNEDFEMICKYCPNLKLVQFSNCFKLNARVLLTLLKLRKLQQLNVDDSNFLCQRGTYAFLISDDEWEHVMCETLKTLQLTSHTVTNDFISYLLDACPYLENLALNDYVTDRYALPFMLNGEDLTTPMNVYSLPSRRKIIYYQKVRVKTTTRGMNKELFSESMKKVMQRNREKKMRQSVE